MNLGLNSASRHSSTAIEQYKGRTVNMATKSDAMKKFLPFWTELTAQQQSDLMSKIDAFRESRSGGLFAKSEDIQSQHLDLIRNTISNYITSSDSVSNHNFNSEELNTALHTIIKNENNNSLWKVRVTGSLNALLFVATDQNLSSIHQRIDNNGFKQILLNNINAKTPKLALMLATAEKLEQFTTREEHMQIMQGILDHKFGRDPEILNKVALGIGNMGIKLNHWALSGKILDCIFISALGTDSVTMLNLAISINKIFKDCDIRTLDNLALHIETFLDKSGTKRTEVALELARGNLFTRNAPAAQEYFFRAIANKKFGTTPEVALALANHIEKMQGMNDGKSLYYLNLKDFARAIRNGVFSRDRNTLIKIIDILNDKVEYLSQDALDHLLLARKNGIFAHVLEEEGFKQLNSMLNNKGIPPHINITYRG